MTTTRLSQPRHSKRPWHICVLVLLILCEHVVATGASWNKNNNLMEQRRRLEDAADAEEQVDENADENGDEEGDVFDSYVGDDDTLTTCEDEIIQVTGIQVVCDSPYTFYYG